MFKFNFDLDDLVDDPELSLAQDSSGSISSDGKRTSSEREIKVKEGPCQEIPLAELLEALPPVISCSPLAVSLPGGTTVTIYRRDLFDARFQLISGNTGGREREKTLNNGVVTPPTDKEDESAMLHRHEEALRFIEQPSDLVPGIYEGGLKTWECSIDLVEYLASTVKDVRLGFFGKHILELGCGTAIPSLYILQNLFSMSNPWQGTEEISSKTKIYLQDYNQSVIELVTLPNVLLAWYCSPASLPFRSSTAVDDNLPFPNPPAPFDLPITPELKEAFTDSLTSYNISLHLLSGAWSALSSYLGNIHRHTFDIVLTSETVYRMDSFPSLVEVMRNACAQSPDARCLVASKVLYFGVGGGVSEFADYLKSNGLGTATIVHEHRTGVGRVIMSLNWDLNS